MNLYLIGYRGAGKSEVAARLSEILDRKCFAVDRFIQQQQNLTIDAIFSEGGEKRFRELESEMIRKVAQERDWIVDLGGGAVVARSNRELIKNSGKCVWLKAAPEVLWQRIQDDEATIQSRPALTEKSGIDEVRDVLRQREPIYAECAEFEIETDHLNPLEVAQQIASWLTSVDNK